MSKKVMSVYISEHRLLQQQRIGCGQTKSVLQATQICEENVAIFHPKIVTQYLPLTILEVSVQMDSIFWLPQLKPACQAL